MTKSGANGGQLPFYAIDDLGSTSVANEQEWRAATELLFDVSPAKDQPFRATLRSHQMGDLLFGKASSVAHGFTRDDRLVAESGIDHILVQLYVQGGYVGEADRREIAVRPGDISVLDLSSTFATRADAFDNYSLVIPRRLLQDRLSHPGNLHGTILPRESALTAMLGEHLRSLDRHVGQFTAQEADKVSTVTTALFSESLLSAERSEKYEQVDASIRVATRIRQYIDRNLANPDLNVPAICEALGFSRASLYRAFKPFGGVSEYMRRHRLRLALRALHAPHNAGKRITAIVKAAGFRDRAAYLRAMKAEFGEDHDKPAIKNMTRGSIANPLATWLRQCA